MNRSKVNERLSRGEKRMLKALEMFSFKKVEKIIKVRIEKKKQSWLIKDPDIYHSQNYNSFLIFGDTKSNNENFKKY